MFGRCFASVLGGGGLFCCFVMHAGVDRMLGRAPCLASAIANCIGQRRGLRLGCVMYVPVKVVSRFLLSLFSVLRSIHVHAPLLRAIGAGQ